MRKNPMMRQTGIKSSTGVSADRKTGLKFIDVNKRGLNNRDQHPEVSRISSNSPINVASKINSSGYVTNFTKYTKTNKNDSDEISVQLKLNAKSMSKLLAYSGIKVKNSTVSQNRLTQKKGSEDIDSDYNDQVNVKIDPVQQYKKVFKKDVNQPQISSIQDIRQKQNKRVHPEIKRKVQNILTANANPIAEILESEIMSPKELEEQLETMIQEDIQDKIATKIAEQLTKQMNFTIQSDMPAEQKLAYLQAKFLRDATGSPQRILKNETQSLTDSTSRLEQFSQVNQSISRSLVSRGNSEEEKKEIKKQKLNRSRTSKNWHERLSQVKSPNTSNPNVRKSNQRTQQQITNNNLYSQKALVARQKLREQMYKNSVSQQGPKSQRSEESKSHGSDQLTDRMKSMSVYDLYKMSNNLPGDQIQIQQLLKKNLGSAKKDKPLKAQPGVAPKVNNELANKISLLDKYVEDIAMNIQDEEDQTTQNKRMSFMMNNQTRNSVILETNDEYIQTKSEYFDATSPQFGLIESKMNFQIHQKSPEVSERNSNESLGIDKNLGMTHKSRQQKEDKYAELPARNSQDKKYQTVDPVLRQITFMSPQYDNEAFESLIPVQTPQDSEMATQGLKQYFSLDNQDAMLGQTPCQNILMEESLSQGTNESQKRITNQLINNISEGIKMAQYNSNNRKKTKNKHNFVRQNDYFKDVQKRYNGNSSHNIFGLNTRNMIGARKHSTPDRIISRPRTDLVTPVESEPEESYSPPRHQQPMNQGQSFAFNATSKTLNLDERLKLLQQKYDNYTSSEPTNIDVDVTMLSVKRRNRKTRSKQCNKTSLGSLEANSSPGIFRRRIPSFDIDFQNKNNQFERLVNKRLQINEKITENSQFQSDELEETPDPRFDLEKIRTQTKTPINLETSKEIQPSVILNQAKVKLKQRPRSSNIISRGNKNNSKLQRIKYNVKKQAGEEVTSETNKYQLVKEVKEEISDQIHMFTKTSMWNESQKSSKRNATIRAPMARKSIQPNEKLYRPLFQQPHQQPRLSITPQRPKFNNSKTMSKSIGATRISNNTVKRSYTKVEIQKTYDSDLKQLRIQAQWALEQLNNQNVRSKVEQIRKPQKYMYFIGKIFQVLYELITNQHDYVTLNASNQQNKILQHLDRDLKDGFNGDLQSDFNDDRGEFAMNKSNIDKELDHRIFKEIQLKSFSQAENELRRLHGHVGIQFNKKPIQSDKISGEEYLIEWTEVVKPFLMQNQNIYLQNAQSLLKYLKKVLEGNHNLQHFRQLAQQILDVLMIHQNLSNMCTKLGSTIFGRLYETVRLLCQYIVKKCDKEAEKVVKPSQQDQLSTANISMQHAHKSDLLRNENFDLQHQIRNEIQKLKVQRQNTNERSSQAFSGLTPSQMINSSMSKPVFEYSLEQSFGKNSTKDNQSPIFNLSLKRQLQEVEVNQQTDELENTITSSNINFGRRSRDSRSKSRLSNTQTSNRRKVSPLPNKIMSLYQGDSAEKITDKKEENEEVIEPSKVQKQENKEKTMVKQKTVEEGLFAYTESSQFHSSYMKPNDLDARLSQIVQPQQIQRDDKIHEIAALVVMDNQVITNLDNEIRKIEKEKAIQISQDVDGNNLMKNPYLNNSTMPSKSPTNLSTIALYDQEAPKEKRDFSPEYGLYNEKGIKPYDPSLVQNGTIDSEKEFKITPRKVFSKRQASRSPETSYVKILAHKQKNANYQKYLSNNKFDKEAKKSSHIQPKNSRNEGPTNLDTGETTHSPTLQGNEKRIITEQGEELQQ